MSEIREEFDIMDYKFKDKKIRCHETNECSQFPKLSDLKNEVIELYFKPNEEYVRLYKEDVDALMKHFDEERKYKVSSLLYSIKNESRIGSTIERKVKEILKELNYG